MRFLSQILPGILITGLAASLPAQDYILRPGTRGFDPSMNRYGATKPKPRPAVRDFNQGDPSRTTLRIEILMPPSGGTLAAQQWSQKLAELGHSARTRSPILDDQPDIQESTRGPLRYVTLIGQLDSRGHLRFPGHSFSLSETAALKEWLEELKTYGAQGSPEGQPLWGLDQTQFEQLHAALGTVVQNDTAGQPLKAAIENLGIPEKYPVSFSAEADQQLRQAGPAKTAGSVAGLSLGTGLAYLLSEQGLGFRPTRMPDSSIELRVEPRPAMPAVRRDPTKTPPVWPVGWDLYEPPVSRHEARESEDEVGQLPLQMRIAPKHFDIAPIGFQNIPLREAFASSTETTGVPVLVSQPALKRAGVDLDTTKVNLPVRHQSWSLALKRVTASVGLRGDLRRDEAGNPLFWVQGKNGTP